MSFSVRISDALGAPHFSRRYHKRRPSHARASTSSDSSRSVTSGSSIPYNPMVKDGSERVSCVCICHSFIVTSFRLPKWSGRRVYPTRSYDVSFSNRINNTNCVFFPEFFIIMRPMMRMNAVFFPYGRQRWPKYRSLFLTRVLSEAKKNV